MDTGERVAERYRIERELGRGGMGTVHVAFDEQRDREIALKVMAASGHAYDEVRARFEREAAIGCALGQERGFVRVFDWGSLSHGRLYLAMDLVRDARPLDLRSGRLSERLDQLARAAHLVERAHALGVLHRDLKPGNFLVDGDGEVWLTDFGLAKLRGEELDGVEAVEPLLTRTGTAMGTPQFMPPEQFEDAKAVDERADVYALGAMLFFLLCGRFPYDGRTPAKVFSRQLETRYGERRAPRPSLIEPGIPPALDALAVAATALDPAARTASASAFGRALTLARRGVVSDGVDAGVMPSLHTTAPDLGPPSAPPASVAPVTTDGVQGSLITVTPRPNPPRREFRAHTSREQRSFWDELWFLQGPRPFVGLGAGAALAIVAVFSWIRAGRDVAYEHQRREPRDPVEWRESLLEPPPPPALPPPLASPLSSSAPVLRLQAAAERGDAQAMLDLAIRLEHGDGVDRDLDASVRWYRCAAQAGHVEAMVCLGELYLEGVGVERDQASARMWFERAATAGSADAQIHLDALEGGRGNGRRRGR